MLSSGLVRLILADAGVLAIAAVGGFLAELPKDPAFPTWTYRIVSSNSIYGLQGEHGLVNVRLQIDCYSDKAAQVITLADAIDRVLSGYQGTLTDTDATYVFGCFRSDLMDPFFDDASRTYRRMLEYEIQFHQAY